MGDKKNLPDEFEQGAEVSLNEATNPFGAMDLLRRMKAVARDAERETPGPTGRGR